MRWDQVPSYMHLDSCLKPHSEQSDEALRQEAAYRRVLSIDDRELEAIMEREFGPIRRPQYLRPQHVAAETFGLLRLYEVRAGAGL